MNSKQKISVIMGIYNCENTLKESIESIIKQTYGNWELIMCDDGSTDNSLKLAKEYEIRDKRIKVIRNTKNKGLAYSLNRCLEIAEGEYVARHDGDDICLPERFEKQISYIKKNNFEFIGSYAKCFDEDGIWGEIKIKENPNILDVFSKSVFIHPTILIKKDVIKSVGGYTISPITYRTEDYDLYNKLYSKGYKGGNLPESLILFRKDKASYKRMKFRYRIDASKCRLKAWKSLNISKKYLPLVAMPVLKGFVPIAIIEKYQSIKFSKKLN